MQPLFRWFHSSCLKDLTEMYVPIDITMHTNAYMQCWIPGVDYPLWSATTFTARIAHQRKRPGS